VCFVTRLRPSRHNRSVCHQPKTNGLVLELAISHATINKLSDFLHKEPMTLSNYCVLGQTVVGIQFVLCGYIKSCICAVPKPKEKNTFVQNFLFGCWKDRRFCKILRLVFRLESPYRRAQKRNAKYFSRIVENLRDREGCRTYIVTCLWLDTGLGLRIGFIEGTILVTTNSYSTTAYVHTQQITIAHAIWICYSLH
jgi:hypothetical protein